MMIVGQKILDAGLVTGGSVENLNQSTYDLTGGEIISIGKEAVRERHEKPTKFYFLEPGEMVLVLSKEEFDLPCDVTGLATLMNTFTKNGILALNVGIIDPFFRGPISSALINFSDLPKRIDIGDKFFRVVLFKHDDVTAFHKVLETKEKGIYTKELEILSYSDFPKSFLNIPSFDNKFYREQFWNVIWYGFTNNKTFAVFVLIIGLVIVLMFCFLIDKGIIEFFIEKLSLLKKIKDLNPF